MEKGKIIVTDALDGAGKETQANLLAEYLYTQGVDFKQLSFPNYESESSFGIKKLLSGEIKDGNPYANSILYSYDRYMTMTDSKVIDSTKSAIEYYNEGGILLLDRYYTSNILYQTIKMSDDEATRYINWLQDLEVYQMGLPAPDLILFLDVPPEISLENIKARGKGNDKYETIEKLSMVYSGVERLKRIHFDMEYIECTENSRMKTREKITELLIEKVEAILWHKISNSAKLTI